MPSGFFSAACGVRLRYLDLRLEMARPKKAAAASRSSGAQATNKGKARATVDVLVARTSRKKHGGAKVKIMTEKRAPLQKGYVAYESEVLARRACIEKAGGTSTAARKDGMKQREAAHVQRAEERSEKLAIKAATDDRDADGASKLAQLKKLTGLERLEWSEEC